jgi:carbamate kinase
MTLDICGAATQGFIGYMIQQTLANRLRDAGLRHHITTVVTQVIVDKDDPAFMNPTKPIGPFYSLEEMERLCRERGWKMIEDSGRGFRRVVASPRPVKIQQARIIRSMLDAGEIVIAAGGGGIPSVREGDGSLRGIEAVIDKDYASSRLAIDVGADSILFLTAAEKVFRDYGLPSQKGLDDLNVAEAKKLLAEGQFGVGSMEPKVRAAIEFLEETSESAQLSSLSEEREVIITLPETVMEALKGKTGTRITR